MPTEVLLGPLAALGGSLIVVGFLARILREYIEELKSERNVWRERSLASDVRTDRLADAFELALKTPARRQ
jgi:hypothetical protein